MMNFKEFSSLYEGSMEDKDALLELYLLYKDHEFLIALDNSER